MSLLDGSNSCHARILGNENSPRSLSGHPKPRFVDKRLCWTVHMHATLAFCALRMPHVHVLDPRNVNSSQLSAHRPNRIRSTQIEPDRARSTQINQIEPYKTKSTRSTQQSQIETDQARSAKSSQSDPDRIRSTQIKPDRARSR